MDRTYNIQEVLAKLLKIPISIEVQKPDSKIQKEKFSKIIEKFEQLIKRSDTLFVGLGVDLNIYEEGYFSLIEDILGLIFNENQIRIINYYLFQKNHPLLEQGDIKDNQGHNIEINTPEELWDIIENLKIVTPFKKEEL
jgi:hypothetical protein